jgi:hypothetical protein
MLVVEFANPRGASRQLGPYDRLRFEGETLVAEPGGVIAKHVDHEWQLTAGGAYTRLDCNAPVKVYFSSRKSLQSHMMGPFQIFSSIDGVAYADREVFAFVDRQNADWYSHKLGTHWKTLIVEPA